MCRRPNHRLTVACVVVTALLAMPNQSRAGRIWDCMFGAAPPSLTTYAPPFSPGYVAPAVAPVCAPACVPTCAPACVPACVPACTSCTPSACQSCQYMPSVVYRALCRPTVVAYQPVVPSGACTGGCGTCVTPIRAAYPVTSYRPLSGTYETRLVPYTTYQPLYATPVAYGAPALPPCTSCGVGGCGVAGGCSSCGNGGGPATYTAPAPTTFAPSPVAPMAPPPMAPPSGGTSYGAPPANAPIPTPATPTPEATPQTPKTFQNEANKPATGPEMNSPPAGDVRPNSMPAPSLPDPNNRRVAGAASARPASLVQPASWKTEADEDDGWRPARE